MASQNEVIKTSQPIEHFKRHKLAADQEIGAPNLESQDLAAGGLYVMKSVARMSYVGGCDTFKTIIEVGTH